MHIGLSPLQSGNNFEATIRECERAEALGFDSVWLGEHHNHPPSLPYATHRVGCHRQPDAAVASGHGGPLAPAVSPSRRG
jgi:alkanesulfonate monooxygenase SsuD/methylene tetrahydromethanopterin reductase-like flavin-dependent oxidoreductase (luciferase family)